MDKIIVINDLLKTELKQYYEYLKSKLGYIATIDDLLLIDEEFIDEELDGDSKLIYSKLNDYVNLNYDEEFDIQINVDKDRSIQLKLLIIINIFEYGLYHYQLLTLNEQKVIDSLSKQPNIMNAIRMYDDNSLTVLNLYSSLFLDSFFNEMVDNRKHILEDNRIDIITSICPYEIFEYRFLLGYKFENEDIKSIKLGKEVIKIMEDAKQIINSDNYDQVKKAITLVIESNPEISSFVENNQNYIISNIYEHLLFKSNLNIKEKEYVSVIEKKGIEGFLQLLFKTDDSLELLITLFYYFNYNCLSEDNLFKLRLNTKKKGKIKIIEKTNPYYYEETSYFSNNFEN